VSLIGGEINDADCSRLARRAKSPAVHIVITTRVEAMIANSMAATAAAPQRTPMCQRILAWFDRHSPIQKTQWSVLKSTFTPILGYLETLDNMGGYS
jgi:hypothetical protein